MHNIINKKILWGVCGIGNGHIYRQFPLIEELKKDNKIIIFAYDASFDFFSQHYHNDNNITIIPVKVPFLPGVGEQLDFTASLQAAQNQHINFFQENITAMSQAQKMIGKPDFVISDYEPVSAQYAYAYDAPLITVDQQSKYLISGFKNSINNCSIVDEQMRLRLFFPHVHHRFACSFFNVPNTNSSKNNITIIPPNLRKGIRNMVREKSIEQTIIVYITANMLTQQSVQEMANVCSEFHSTKFTFVIPNQIKISLSSNCEQMYHGDTSFDKHLSSCHGIVSTAGHGLLSEAVYLGIPVYAIPLPIYEQQMNASIISDYGFGVQHDTVTKDSVQDFLNNLGKYADSISQNQKEILVKQTEKNIVLEYISKICTPNEYDL